MPKHLTRIVRRKRRRYRRPLLIVLHTTEGHNRRGVGDLTSLAGFFRRIKADSTIAVDQEGNSIRLQPDNVPPWTQRRYNEVSLSIEQVGFSYYRKKYWVKEYHRGLYRTAQWIAYWSTKYGIPIKHSKHHGVCQHRDLRPLGGTHTDCGPNYPLRYVLVWARLIQLRNTGRRKKREARLLKGRVRLQQRRAGIRKPNSAPW